MGRLGYNVVDADGHIYETLEMHEQFRDHYLEKPYSRLLGDMLQEMRAPQYAGRTGNDSSGSFLWTLRSSKPQVLGRWRALGLPRDQKVELPKNMATRTGSRAETAPLDPAVRLLDMDLEGIDTAVIYPSRLNYYCAMDDVDLEAAIYRAYNRWMSDHCRHDPARLRYIAVVSMRDIEGGVQEIMRVAKDPCAVAVYSSSHMGDVQLDDPAFHPLWQAAQEVDLPIGVHHASAGGPPWGLGVWEMTESWYQMHATANPTEQMRAVLTMIGGGVFERFPRLRVVFLEGGCGWLPWWLERLDEHREIMPTTVPLLNHQPSYFFRNGQCYISFDPDEVSLPFVLNTLGDTQVVYASDYPHWDGRFPDSVKVVAERTDISGAAKRRVLSENAKRLYTRL